MQIEYEYDFQLRQALSFNQGAVQVKRNGVHKNRCALDVDCGGWTSARGGRGEGKIEGQRQREGEPAGAEEERRVTGAAGASE